MIGTALLVAMIVSELPPPPLVDAVDVYSPPPLVEAIDRPVAAAHLVPEVPEVRSAPRTVAKPVEESRPFVGVAFDAAAPDGAGVNVMLRPFKWLEVHGGMAHNAITPGWRGGLTFLPADRWFVPTLTLEMGTHPPGDANPLLQTLIGNDALRFDALENIGYDYANGMLGFTLGSREHFTLYFRGGVTRVVGRAGDSELVGGPGGGGASGGSSGSVTSQPITLFLPALKAGFAIYFF